MGTIGMEDLQEYIYAHIPVVKRSLFSIIRDEATTTHEGSMEILASFTGEFVVVRSPKGV